MSKICQYQCGSCGRKFCRLWTQEQIDTEVCPAEGEDLFTCPCDLCGAQGVDLDMTPYKVYMDGHLVGYLMLETIKEIHGSNISFIDHIKREVFVRYIIPQDVWDDIPLTPLPYYGMHPKNENK
jgi:hypothetical protein